MNQNLISEQQLEESVQPGIARVVTSPECLSASIITICHGVDPSEVDALVGELSRQTAAVHRGSMARAESMLVAQAHTLDGLFAKLASLALKAPRLGVLEQYMKLALRSQNQARATLQTLAEIKAPRQISFVQQANVGNNVQVNNSTSGSSGDDQRTLDVGLRERPLSDG